jgi:hypothetical protein
VVPLECIADLGDLVAAHRLADAAQAGCMLERAIEVSGGDSDLTTDGLALYPACPFGEMGGLVQDSVHAVFGVGPVLASSE